MEGQGFSQIVERSVKPPWLILSEQFTVEMVLILIAAAALSALVGDWKDTVVILPVVVLFAVLRFVQEYRTEKAMAALKRLSQPTEKHHLASRVGIIIVANRSS